MKPSVGFSYSPESEKLSSDMYRTVQYDTLGNTREYSIYEGSIYGTPSAGMRSGSVTFGLSNIVEAKVFAKNDTTGKPKKIKLIESLSLNTSYNIFSDSLNWSPVGMSFRTTLAENINLQASSTFNPYAINENGITISQPAISQGQGLARMTNLNMSLDFDLGQLLKGKEKGRDQQTSGGMGQQGAGRTSGALGEDGAGPHG